MLPSLFVYLINFVLSVLGLDKPRSIQFLDLDQDAADAAINFLR